VEALFWIAVVVAGTVIAYLRARRHERRARALAARARRLGLEFAALDLFNDGWQPFRLFGMGTHRGVENVLYGRLAGVVVHGFDYWYSEGEDVGPVALAARRRFSCAVVGIPASCPPLIVQPRDQAEELDRLLGGDVLTLELEEFNRRFRIRCEDRMFAVAFLEQRMMSALLAIPVEAALAVAEDRMLLVSKELPPDGVDRLLRSVVHLTSAVPRSLASRYPLRPGSTGRLERPEPERVIAAFDRLLALRRTRQRY
jgi:hypothetical protein